MLSGIFLWSFSVFQSLLSQCITIVSGLCLILGTTNDFMLLVFAPGKVSHNKFVFPIRYLPAFHIFSNRVSNKNSHVFCTVTNSLISFPSMYSWIIFIFVLQIRFSNFVTRNYFLIWIIVFGKFHLMICLMTYNQIY